jgi:hypothetical protein
MQESTFLEAGLTQRVEKPLEFSEPEVLLTRSDISATGVDTKFKRMKRLNCRNSMND